MFNYKDPSGRMHSLDDQEFEHLLPAGSVGISDEEARKAQSTSNEDVWCNIKAERDRRTEKGGYKVSVDGADKWFHGDQKSRSQQQDNEAEGVNLVPIQWKTMDGSFVTMTAELAAQIRVARMASDREIFAVAESHRALMEAFSDPSAYDFSTGWPATFADEINNQL